MTARIEYAPGEAWCIAAGRVVLVCERDLPAVRARALHDAAAVVDSVERLRTVLELEPAALLGLVDLGEGRVLLRRHGVPATADEEPLDDRFGADWGIDDAERSSIIAAGAISALTPDVLPLEGGVVRVAAVRVVPRPLDAPGDLPGGASAEAVAKEAPRTGAFGETLPPRGPEREQEPATVARRLAETVPAPEPAPVPEPARQPEPEPVPASSRTAATDPVGGLIDSVPGFIRPAVDLHVVEPPAAHPPAPAPWPGDHDGMTITAEQARRLQEDRARSASDQGRTQPAQQQQVPATAPATGPLVLSTLCPAGHVNAPGTLACVRCGAAVDDGSAAQRPRPEVAVAVLPSGERVPLGRGVVLGRRPRSRRAEDGRVPRLVTVDSPGEDISRSHLELRVDDWNLIAIDLSSTNGTLLLRAGAAPQRLRPEASTILQLGDRLDLGERQVITIEAAP